MSLEEVKALSDEELRVKVAELCGWRKDPRYDIHWLPPGEEPNKFGYCTARPPNYPADLNACADFTKWLRAMSREWYGDYNNRLQKLVAIDNCEFGADIVSISDASPVNKCRAFILTMEGAK